MNYPLMRTSIFNYFCYFVIFSEGFGFTYILNF